MIGPAIKSIWRLPLFSEQSRAAVNRRVDRLGLHLRRHMVRNGRSLRDFEQNRCIFIHIPKTAGSAIGENLFGHLGGGHMTYRDYQWVFNQIYGVKDFDQYFKFAFVRNPWDRVVSAFAFLRDGGNTWQDQQFLDNHRSAFENFNTFIHEWLSEHTAQECLHLRPQIDFLCDDSGQMAVDYLGRYELLHDDYENIRAQLGIGKPLPKRKTNQSSHRHYREYYDKEAVEKVAKIYDRDIKELGYRFDN